MRGWRALGRSLILIFLVFGVGESAQGEIYRWVDSSGKVHFTQDLGRVPQQYRSAAQSGAKEKPRRDSVQYVAPSVARYSARSTVGRRTGDPTIYKVHRIRVQQAGSTMMVSVRINDQLDVPFHVDTGASDVVLPLWAAKELGLKIEGEDVRTNLYGTANGTIESAVVMLDSVSLGSATVNDVVGSVSKSMQTGLLGLSFFNHFTYNIDAANGIMTLTENQLEEDGLIRGGRSEPQWRGQFTHLRARVLHAESELESVPFSRARRREEAEEKVDAIERQLEILEDEADDAHVPHTWRD